MLSVLNMAQKKCVNHQRKANGVGTLDRLMSKSMESFGDLSESCHNIVWSNNMKGWPLKVDLRCVCLFVDLYVYHSAHLSVCV